MRITFDIDRYKKLLQKNEFLSQQNKSLILENKNEFLELLTYSARVGDQICYERKKEYYFLISQYVKKKANPSVTVFESKFLEMSREDCEAAEIITNDFKQLSNFSVDLEAVKFSSLIGKIYDVCLMAREFGPEDGISDQEFRKSVEETYFEIRTFLKK